MSQRVYFVRKETRDRSCRCAQEWNGQGSQGNGIRLGRSKNKITWSAGPVFRLYTSLSIQTTRAVPTLDFFFEFQKTLRKIIFSSRNNMRDANGHLNGRFRVPNTRIGLICSSQPTDTYGLRKLYSHARRTIHCPLNVVCTRLHA